MRFRSFATSVLAIAAFVCAPLGHAQELTGARANEPIKFKRIEPVFNKAPLTENMRAAIRRQSVVGQTIPLWGYTVTAAQNSQVYSGLMVGRSPFAHGHRATIIPTYLIPLKLTFADTSTVFDASAPDSCAPAGESVITLIQNSPLITPANFTMNGVNVGTGQYVDEFQRASFWSEVQGTPYHTAFSTTPTVLSPISVTVPTTHGTTYAFGGCKPLGLMDIDWWDSVLQNTILPALALQGVGPADFPQFITNSVVEYQGSLGNCCILGYHSAYLPGGILHTYSMNAYDNSGAFGGDSTTTMSHEIGEWLDDPNGNNPTPAWGNEGQVVGACQNNLEVGDPLSANATTPTNPFSVTNTTTGVTYSLQELAFFSWFLGSSPSLGAGGKYSDNGTFSGYSKLCPPGGTN